MRTNWLRIVQSSLAALSLFTAVAIVGTAGHTLHVYRSQNDASNPWWLPLWPAHFDVAGTKVFIGTGSAILFLSLVYLAVTAIPSISISTKPKLAAFATLSTAVLSILLVVSALVFNDHLERSLSHDRKDSIHSWTCQFKHTQTANIGVAINGTSTSISNVGFSTVCNETLFGFWGMVGALVLHAGLLASAGIQWWYAPAKIGGNPKASTSDINLSST